MELLGIYFFAGLAFRLPLQIGLATSHPKKLGCSLSLRKTRNGRCQNLRWRLHADAQAPHQQLSVTGLPGEVTPKNLTAAVLPYIILFSMFIKVSGRKPA
jgi:hypothetical protein